MIFPATADARFGAKGSQLTAQDVAELRKQALRFVALLLVMTTDPKASRPCESRDPYGAASRFGTMANGFCSN